MSKQVSKYCRFALVLVVGLVVCLITMPTRADALPKQVLVSLNTPVPKDQDNEWKTYADTDFQFILQYPSDNWTFQISLQNDGIPDYEIRRRVRFVGPNRAVIHMDVWDNKVNYSLIDWLQVYHPQALPGNVSAPTQTNAQVSGLPAVFLIQSEERDSPARLITFFANERSVYRLRYFLYDGGLAQQVYAHMLNNFTLANQPQGNTELPAMPVVPLSPSKPLDLDCCGYHDDCNPYSCCSDTGNCVWWANFKRSDIGCDSWGMPANWIGEAQAAGFPTGSTPKYGAIAVFDPGECYASADGHVAIVEATGDTSYTISEQSYCANCGSQRSCANNSGATFIYFKCCCGALTTNASKRNFPTLLFASYGPALLTVTPAPTSVPQPSLTITPQPVMLTVADAVSSTPVLLPTVTPSAIATDPPASPEDVLPDDELTQPPDTSRPVEPVQPEIAPTANYLELEAEPLSNDLDQPMAQENDVYWPALEEQGLQSQNQPPALSHWTRSRAAGDLDTARPASASYRLARSALAMGGGLKASSSYQVHGVSGQTTGVKHLQSSSYQVYSGYWGIGDELTLVTLSDLRVAGGDPAGLGLLGGLAILLMGGWLVLKIRR